MVEAMFCTLNGQKILLPARVLVVSRPKQTMDVFKLRKQVIGDYHGYVKSFIHIGDPRIEHYVERELNDGFLWPEPLVQLNPNFEPGEPIETLVQQDILHPECLRIFAKKDEPGRGVTPIRLHRHQIDGIKAARQGKNYVLTTGTGSGKSLSYIVPIVDFVLRNRSNKGRIQAIIVYPMNALANSQMGELEKFLCLGYDNKPPVTFQRYTGQVSTEQRRSIITNPPDILLTNFVMLELLLTRPKESDLIQSAQDLRFLVLDELHTYRGRQGADVAMLIRRVREACRADRLIHIGTSATLAGEGTWEDQQLHVANMASELFGKTVDPSSVIGENLRRLTPELPQDQNAFLTQLCEHIENGETLPVSNAQEFLRHPLAIWIESNLGLRTEAISGRRLRQQPMPLGGSSSASEKLAQDTRLSQETCRKALEQALMAGYQCKDAEGRPIFAFRLHQFISKGESVYASLEPESSRYITLQAQQYVPGTDRSKVLLPLVFCRECGQDYYAVVRTVDNDGRIAYVSGELTDDIPQDEKDRDQKYREGYLYISQSHPWPPKTDKANLYQRLPENWLELDKNGQKTIRKNYKDKCPQDVSLSPKGEEGVGPNQIQAHFIEAPFRFCLHCGIAYDAHQRSDFGKLATLGSEGRSTATTILSLSTIRRLHQDPSLEDNARKLLSFTDNRQDASLQAGHFNDFVEISQLRSALLRAVQTAGPEGIRHEELTRRVFESLNLPLELYAQNPHVEEDALYNTQRAMREVLGYYLYRDLQRGWRITSPNLEQCGLLKIDYISLESFCANASKWNHLHPALAGAAPEDREKICRVLLDTMRRDLAVRVDYLYPQRQEEIYELSRQHLKAPWTLDDYITLEKSRIVFPRAKGNENKGSPRHVFLSPLGGFALFLKRATTLPHISNLKTEDLKQIIQELLESLEKCGALQITAEAKNNSDVPGYQIKASAMIWKAGEGTHAFHDWVRVPNAPNQGLRVNAFFAELYRQRDTRLQHIEAREHTAQVSNRQREDREQLFREGRLPLLFCSPTMELGVDISSLNAVNMRNIPPTPANYAQRSGRAGRSGQPAFVFTYCSAGSPHDQYFFKRPSLMVSGAVSTPRVDLKNEDLLRSHVHAVWLSESQLDLGESLADVLDVSGDNPTLELLPHVREKLEAQHLRDKTLILAKEALGNEISALLDSLNAGEGVHAWIDRVLRELPHSFLNACERWKSLYRSARRQYNEQSKIVLDASKSPKERESASRARNEAQNQFNLLTDKGNDNSDFYSYRYFACEGFLPGYNFPRLPLSAYLSGQNRRKNSDDQLSRPRFLAISEFGPRSLIYHEGSRYIVHKIIKPADGESDIFSRTAQLCEACGYLHPITDARGLDICQRCKEKLPQPGPHKLLSMQNVSALRRARINSDEEERVRIGYDIKTGFRFAERGGMISAQRAHLLDDQGRPLATLTYGHAATLWRINLGWRRRKDKGKLGFWLDIEQGKWDKAPQESDSDAGDEQDSPAASRREQVIPYVEDHRNCLLIQPECELVPESMASLEYALKSAMQVEFQLEDRELASEALPNDTQRRLLLFYEASEGGAGVLRRIVEEPGLLRKIIRNALDICHYHPDTGTDQRRGPRSKEDCESACYDCLLSYYNQRHHALLDRTLLPALLLSWRDGYIETSPAPISRAEHMSKLEQRCQSELEKRWLFLMDRMGLRLPSHAQYAIEACSACPDFAYTEQNTLIFIDGPPHDTSEQKRRDKQQDEVLENHGWTIIRFHHSADWEHLIAQWPILFGSPTAPADLPPPAAPVSPPAAFDPQRFEEQWHPLLQRLQTEPGIRIEPGQEIQRAGRIIGETLVTLHRRERILHLIDASVPNAAELVKALEGRGQQALRVRPELTGMIERILGALN